MKKRIIDILTDLRPEFDFSQDVNFIEQGMLDSFDVFNLAVQLEKEFGIKIDGTDIVACNFSSVENIIKLVTKK